MSVKPTKVCLISHTMHMGGMERAMAGLANCFVKKPGLKIYLILLLKMERYYPLNTDIEIIEPPFLLKSMPKWLYAIRTLFWLRGTIKRISPSTILSFGEYWNSFVLIATRGLNYPKYVSDRSNPLDNFRFFHEFLRKYLYKSATGIIAQTQSAAEILMQKTGNKNSLVVGNPIRNIHNKGENRGNIIISVGRLIPFKQHAKLIKLFDELKDPSWKLQILGDGPLYDDLVKLINELGLESQVELLGSVKNVDDYLLKAKIFAFTSYYEGFPNALAEGMSAGLAPISFDCPAGPADLITDGKNGFLIPLNNDELFINRLKVLTSDEKLIEHFGSEARKFINNNYGESKVSDSILNFILADKRYLHN